LIILSAVTHRRAQLAVLARYRDPDHSDLKEAKINLEEAKLAELVDKAEAQRARIAALQGDSS
jgi:hypothetical protein